MRIRDLIKMGLRNLARRKTRTILTVLGVVIGSLSIIIMVSIGQGMQQNFDKQIKELGSLTIITVRDRGYIYDEDGNYSGSVEQELNDDLVKQLKEIEHVRAVTPVLNKSVRLLTGKYEGWAYITAMDSEAFDDFDFPGLTMGEYPNQEDNSGIVFGANAVEFYDTGSRGWNWTPVDVDLEKSKIILKFQDYPTNERKKEFSVPLKNIAKMEETNGIYDWNTYMDLEYFKEIYLKYCNTLNLEDRKRAIKTLDDYTEIRLNVDNIDNVEDVQDKIKEMGFQTESDMQYLSPMIEASNTLQMVLLALGTVAMVVSAISIANTMVMSIYERTKEIGIMKVLGCVIKDIRKLFLFEAGMIGFIGGIVGNILGFIAAWLINKYGQPLFKALMSGNYMYDMTNTTFAVIPFYLPFAAIGLSVLVGVLSGYFPARRATKIRTIEAMKSEG